VYFDTPKFGSKHSLKRKENEQDRTPKRERDEAVGSFARKGTERTTVKMDLGGPHLVGVLDTPRASMVGPQTRS
jgi:hypothetical protein